MARVPLRTPSELPESYRYLLDDSAIGQRHILQAASNNPPLFQSSMRYSSTVWSACGLSDRERELVILTVASAMESRYEWHQHVPLAREAGVSTDELHAIRKRCRERFDDDERRLLEYADAVVRGAVTDDARDALRSRFDDEAVVGITVLASNYAATARWLDALDVELEEPFVGWRPADDD